MSYGLAQTMVLCGNMIKTTERSLQDNFSFQGVIILPSRLAFARNNYFVGTGLTEYSSFRDASFIFNFEIPQIEDRVKK